ncbi:hypothetical protein BBP40_003787 [Aspergillus hancockii]|nr:hypothetical protein BBP40_003787 [Aspergillus hancockii]
MADVNENALLNGRVSQGLRVRIVKPSVDDLSKIAVVSWRWDGHDRVWGLRNIFYAVRPARRMDFQDLLIEFVSIDQSVSGRKLLSHMVAFSALYRTIQVIAANDTLKAFGKFAPLSDTHYIACGPSTRDGALDIILPGSSTSAVTNKEHGFTEARKFLICLSRSSQPPGASALPIRSLEFSVAILDVLGIGPEIHHANISEHFNSCF